MKHTMNATFGYIETENSRFFLSLALSLSVSRCECVLTRPSDSRVLRDSEPTFNANATSNADL